MTTTLIMSCPIYVSSTPFNRIAGSLRPALRIWAQVLSTPTTTLALVGAGKRDVPYDADRKSVV